MCFWSEYTVTERKNNKEKTGANTMKNAYELRAHFGTIGDWNTSISRKEFEQLFHKTAEKVTFTFGGWDGKSYDGESHPSANWLVDVRKAN